MLFFIDTVNFNFPPTSNEEIVMKLSELSGELVAVVNQVTKVREEILARIDELEDALLNVDLPIEAEFALEALRAGIQGLDDLNPDVVVNPE